MNKLFLLLLLISFYSFGQDTYYTTARNGLIVRDSLGATKWLAKKR